MTANNGDADLPAGFTLPDLRAFSRLGYKINLFATPRLYGTWKRTFGSGTYFGVVGFLLVSPRVEFKFAGSDGTTCVISSQSTTYLTEKQGTTDVGQFLIRRKNLFSAFRLSMTDKLPELKKGAKWTVSVRNWSDVLSTLLSSECLWTFSDVGTWKTKRVNGVMLFPFLRIGFLLRRQDCTPRSPILIKSALRCPRSSRAQNQTSRKPSRAQTRRVCYIETNSQPKSQIKSRLDLTPGWRK